MNRRTKLLSLLSDGGWHSGEALAETLGISRAGVWKQLDQLKVKYGLQVHSVRGRGYRLPNSLELLDRARINELLPAHLLGAIPQIEILDSVESTNSYLMEKMTPQLVSGQICLAERQTGGRGRRGRHWVSPFGSNIYFSMYRRFAMAPAELSGVSLVAGLAVINTLKQLGVEGVGLKWPNDVLYNGRKLAGLLLEVSGEQSGPSNVVIGIGLNVHLPSEQAGDINQPWIDLKQIPGGELLTRNQLVASLVENLQTVMDRFEKEGFEPLRLGWRTHDVYDGKDILLQFGDRTIKGIHRGIDETGALLVETAEGVKAYHGGEVSLRPA
ncbi:MAG: bifunctional biotin--[acetyl-CoA-carboxylase] ligase/biotin operon repressor BirA [Sedimenticola sp.]|nr:bifunctional biotin--[acetyl-CoA-carboxylase] ligase/biotin operon repressor BirA [Sedimenticola sp.]